MTSPTATPPPDPGADPPGAQPPPAAPPGTDPPGWQPGGQPGWGYRGRHRDERRGAIVGGVILVLIGAAFLVQEFVPDVDVGRFWPVILIVVGGALIISSVRRAA